MGTIAQRRARLWARHHLRRDADVVNAVRDLVAVHSSDPLTPHLAAWSRVPGYQVEALHDALEVRALWRMHAMRRTLWVVDADEAPIFDGAAGRVVAAKERRRLLGWIAAERDDAKAWVAELEAEALAAIREAPGVFTRTLGAAVPGLTEKVTLGSGKWASRAAVGSKLLFVLAMEGKLFRTPPAGSWRSSQYGWAVAPGGFGATRDEKSARADLMRRYLRRFGPVTFVDARWWTGWTAAQTQQAFAEVGAVEVALEGAPDEGTGWVLPGDADVVLPEPSGVALLPALDPTPMGYKERGWFLGEHGSALFDRNGNVGPTVWAEGRIVGGWAIRDNGTVVTRLLDSADEGAVAAEAEALTVWLAGTSATPRFRTPLERDLAGS